jgi:protein TonB
VPAVTDSTLLYRVIKGKDTTLSVLSRLPIYLDGATAFANAIGRAVRYPRAAREAQKTGMVIISFTIGNNGAVSNYRVIKSLGYGMDESALDAVKSATGEWLPAMVNGEPVSIEYDVPVRFSLAM